MTMTDPIADMLTRIRNAYQARHPVVEMPASNHKAALAEVLRDEGYIKSFGIQGDGPKKTLKIELHYTDAREPVLTGVRRISKPGLRVYADAKSIPRVYGGLGVTVLSTSKGVMSGGKARRLRVGGEILCHIW